MIKTGERPCHPGLYLLDKVGDVEGRRLTHYEENDNDGLISLLTSGAQLLLFTTGRGSVVGSVLAPVIKVCGNPFTHERMGDNMEVNAGTIIAGPQTIADVGADIVCLVESVVDGALTCASRAQGRRCISATPISRPYARLGRRAWASKTPSWPSPIPCL